jgi:hypothetical protein
MDHIMGTNLREGYKEVLFSLGLRLVTWLRGYWLLIWFGWTLGWFGYREIWLLVNQLVRYAFGEV